MVLVDLATATICFLSQCYPVLIGTDTPTGEFRLEQVRTQEAGYGGGGGPFLKKKKSLNFLHPGGGV